MTSRPETGMGMFETGIRQFRLAIGMVWGRGLDPAILAKLVDDSLATLAEFGSPGAGARELVDGPFADAEERTEFTVRSLRRTARRLAKQSPFYARRFAAAGIRPEKLDLEGMRAIPTTTKRDLIDQRADFVCADASPHLVTRTTGTTGRAAEIWMSRRELELWSGMSALTGLIRGEIDPSDVIHVHLSSRATASVSLTAAIARLVGMRCRILGVIPPDQALDALLGEATLLAASPSYLAQLVVAARRRGLTPRDFRLKRIECGGEVLSPSVRAAAEETFGARVSDSFGMTEVIPVTGATCSQGHLHHDLNTGAVELLDLASGEPAAPGALSTVVITPYHPFRECMPVFRYDTRDVVRAPVEGAASCEIAGLPGTGPIVGKADQMLWLSRDEVVAPRDLVDAVEALPSQPWPGRFRAEVRGGRLNLTLPECAASGLAEADLHQHFLNRGIDPAIDLVPDDQATALRLLRCDLRETTFVDYPMTGDHHASR